MNYTQSCSFSELTKNVIRIALNTLTASVENLWTISNNNVCVSQAEIDAAVQLLLKLKLEYKKVTGQDYKPGSPPSENSAPFNGPAEDGTNDEDTVNPWNVSTSNAKGVDYDKLIGAMKLFYD